MPCAEMAVGCTLPTPLLLGVDALAGIVSLRDLVKEVAVNPTNPTVLFNFGATLERLGEKDHLAAVVYMRALDFETEGRVSVTIFPRFRREYPIMSRNVDWYAQFNSAVRRFRRNTTVTTM